MRSTVPDPPGPGGCVILRPTTDGDYTIERTPHIGPTNQAMTADESRFFTRYDGLSRLELMRRLRRYEWNTDLYKKRAEALEREARQLPPLHLIQEVHGRLERLRALAQQHPRSVPTKDVLAVLETRDDVQAVPE